MPRIQLPRLSRIAVAAAASAAMIGSSFITPAHADTVPGVADTTALTSPVAPADAFKGDATPNSLEPESADPGRRHRDASAAGRRRAPG
ncbi:Protein of unknown function [Propionibacterium freudenreichii]|nr:Protein of unknown function [Propionibacterium freudenreichii]